MSGAAPVRSTIVDVDLDAIAANVSALRRRAGAEVIAVVKDDAYGHGVEAVGRAAVEAGAIMLAVFTVEEALVVRGSGIDAPLLALAGAAERAEAEAAIAAGCALAVWDEEGARLVADAAAAAGRRARVHFKVDTGLTRLGAPFEQAAGRYRTVRDMAGLEVDGIFTHFASADETDLTQTRAQVRRFTAVLDEIGEPPRLVHAAASAGVAALGSIPRCTAVRPGLSLYGVHAAEHHAAVLALRPALEWRSRVRRVASVPRGTGVSYGHEYRLPRDGRIATIPVGYGDGLPRAFARRGRILLGGRALPIAGRIAMDLVMVDVTDAHVALGDEAVLIGEQSGARQSAQDVADALGTIAYEVLTGIRRRVPRRYRRGDRIVAYRTLADGYVPA